MNIQKKIFLALIACTLLGYQTPSEANKYKHSRTPELVTRWIGTQDDPGQTYYLKASYLRQDPIFYSFDKEHFQSHMLPAGTINYRNQAETVETAQLNQEINEVITELREGKTEFQHFTVLKDREFNQKEFAGAIVLKFNNHPLVLKIFAESPESFLHPERKGFRHGCMAKMTGGLNRYLAGFRRISNLEFAQQFITTMNEPALQLDFPRKWYWQPENNKWFEVIGTNFSEFENTQLKTELPELYAIIADEIVCHKRLSQIRKQYGRRIFKLCQQFKFNIDPNMKNFRLEQDTNKMVLIDTEHFPSVLGFKTEIQADNYFSLHIKMGLKAIHDCWLT